VTSARTRVDGLAKDFGDVRALAGVTLDIRPGEVHALLGANGAGKSTLMRCLLGYLRPTRGTVTVLDGNSRDPDIRTRIGYLPGDLRLPARSTVAEILSFHSRLLARAGRPPSRRDDLVSRLALPHDHRFGTLSKGNRQKVGLVLALMADPEVLVLDEPTSGLDPLMQEEVMDLVRERRDAGCAILLSTHILAEAESIADRVAVLSRGLLMIDMSLDELLERARQALEVTLESPAPADLLEGIPGIAEVTVSGCEVRLIVLGSAAQAITRLAPYGVRRVTTRAHELDEMFQQATARDA
jgi:ABC-2 type transport system ATP-binding protein